ncbi:MAG: DUF4870 domain-containing protein [Aggregatilineales bacterium]
MSSEVTEQTTSDDERVTRLSAHPDGADADAVVQEYEARYRGPRKPRPKPQEWPRSYSTLRVSDNERLWASAAHASAWVTFAAALLTAGAAIPVTIFVPLAIYFMFRKQSDYVAFHALQAFVLQLVGTVGALALLTVGVVLWVIGLLVALLLVVLLVGFVLVPVWGIVGIALLVVVFLMPFGMVMFGTIGAVQTHNGRDYRYPYIAQWVDRQLAGSFLDTI